MVTDFVAGAQIRDAERVPGTALYLSHTPRHVPRSRLHNLRHNRALHREIYILQVQIEDSPRVRLEDKLALEPLGAGFFAAVLRFGYMEMPRFNTILSLLRESAYPPIADQPSLFLRHARIDIDQVASTSRWRAWLYAYMQRNTPSPAFVLDAPPERVIEIGMLQCL